MSQVASDFGIASIDSLDSDDPLLADRQSTDPSTDGEAQAAATAFIGLGRDAFARDTNVTPFHSQLDHALPAAATPPDPQVTPAPAPVVGHLVPQTDLDPWPAVFDVTTLDGTNGFVLDFTFQTTLSNADLNGDGFSDIISGGVTHNYATSGSFRDLVVYGKAGAFPAEITPSVADGVNGFAILGRASETTSGFAPSSAGIGDFNGDGYDDAIIDGESRAFGVNAYIAFGRASFGAVDNVAQGLGTTSLQISTPATHNITVTAAGDVNGDGFADVIIGHYFNDSADQANYVVFGHGGAFPAIFDVGTVDGTDGFKLTGTPGLGGDRDGLAIASAGDVNGDGISDLVFGAYGDNNYTGGAYVVFGHTGSFSPNVDLTALSGTDGFKLTGVSAGDFTGRVVASVGDFNGDGFADLAITSGNAFATESTYIVFGHGGSFASTFDLSTLNGSNGFKLTGAGRWVSSAGDVNGDGFSDFIVGNPGTTGNLAGNAYVVFGQASGFSSTFDVSTLNGTNGFAIAGETTGPRSQNETGFMVSSAGDLNGDGFSDLLVGGGANSYNQNQAVTYVIYGRLPDVSVNRTGTAASQTLAGGNFDDILSGLGGNDQLYGNGGNDTLTGGTGADTYHFSSSGPANVDTVTDYSFSDGDKIDLSGLVDAHAATIFTISDYVRLTVSGGDLTVQTDSDGTGSGVTWADVAVLTGAAADPVAFQIGAQTIILAGSGDDAVTGPAEAPALFDLSAGGDDTATGGNHDDGFKFGAAYTPADHVDGGAGGNDQIALQGDYSAGVTLSGSSIANVEVMALLPGFNYNFTTTDDLVASGQTMSFWSIQLTSTNHVAIDGSAETDGAFKFYLGQGDDVAIGGAGADLFYGEGGADTLTGNGGADIFASRVVTDSTGATYDTITDFTAGTDKFDLPVTVLAVDTTVATGALSSGSFDTDLATAVGAAQLASGHAVLFTPDSGGLATHTFLIVDANGTAGYQAGADYVFDVTGGSLGGLAAGDFI